jgi:lysozyme
MATKRQVGIGAIGGAAMAAAVTLVANWEGLYTDPYKDIVGVWTVCFGETAADNVAMRHYSADECKAMLPKSLVKYDDGIRTCLTRDIPNSMRIAFLSAAYNIGVKAFCGSSMARLANAGELERACDALLNWDRAGGRVIKGLHNRREDERRVCRRDLNKG